MILKNRENEYFELLKDRGSTYEVVPYGGGLVFVAPASDFEVVSSIPTRLVRGIASIDGEGEYLCLFNPKDRWNGWMQPYFSGAMLEIILHERCSGDDISRREKEIVIAHDECNQSKAILTPHGWQLDGWCWDVKPLLPEASSS